MYLLRKTFTLLVFVTNERCYTCQQKWRKRTKKKEGGVWKRDNIKCIYHTTDGKIQMKQ